MDECRVWLATKDPPFIHFFLKFRVLFKCAHWRGLAIGCWSTAPPHASLLACRVIAFQAATAAHTPRQCSGIEGGGEH